MINKEKHCVILNITKDKYLIDSIEQFNDGYDYFDLHIICNYNITKEYKQNLYNEYNIIKNIYNINNINKCLNIIDDKLLIDKSILYYIISNNLLNSLYYNYNYIHIIDIDNNIKLQKCSSTYFIYLFNSKNESYIGRNILSLNINDALVILKKCIYYMYFDNNNYYEFELPLSNFYELNFTKYRTNYIKLFKLNYDTKIYLSYHIKNSDNYKSYNIINYYTQDDNLNKQIKNINKYQEYFNEFTTMYFVYKNYDKFKFLKSKYIGFCHYRRYFDYSLNKANISGTLYTPNNEYNDFYNDTDGLNKIDNFGDYDLIGFANFSNKEYMFLNIKEADNNLYKILLNFLVGYYPYFVERFLNINNAKDYEFVRFNTFIMKFDDFIDYMNFITEIIKYIGLDIDNINYKEDIIYKLDRFNLRFYTSEQFYIKNQHRRIAYFIEYITPIYFYLQNYNILYKFINQ